MVSDRDLAMAVEAEVERHHAPHRGGSCEIAAVQCGVELLRQTCPVTKRQQLGDSNRDLGRAAPPPPPMGAGRARQRPSTAE